MPPEPIRFAYRELRTRRLRLRRPRPGDAPLVFASFGSDPEVTLYLTWRPHRTVVDAEAALAARLERLAAATELSWILELEAGDVAGLISAWPDAAGAEVGFVVARPHQGQGLATEALRSVTDWALSSPGATRIWATCDCENGASARVLAKAGYEVRGEHERRILRPNIGPEPRPSLLFTLTLPAG